MNNAYENSVIQVLSKDFSRKFLVILCDRGYLMVCKNKRFLVLVSDFDISPLTVSIVKSFSKANVEIELTLLGSNNDWLQEHLTEIPIEFTKITTVGKFHLLQLVTFFYRKLLFGRYDGVYSSGQIATFVGITSGWLSRTKIRVFTRHHSDENHIIEKIRFSLFRAFLADLLINRMSTKIVAVSPAVRDILLNRERVKLGKVIQINNGIEISKLLNLEVKKSKSDVITIGVMSRMTNVKGVDYIAKAFVDYNRINPRSKLIIAGAKSSLYPKIAKTLSALDESKFEFVEKFDNNTDFYSSIDIFVHTPIRKYGEAFGLVYLEAIVAGKICIYSESGILLNDSELAKYYFKVRYQNSDDILEELKNAAKSLSADSVRKSVKIDFTLEAMEQKYADLWRVT
jgi:glycosyltransferase involved in cell wall biosynthesis